MNKPSTLAALALSALAISTAQADTLTVLQPYGLGTSDPVIVGVNNSGQVVGDTGFGVGVSEWSSDGTITRLPTNGSFGLVSGINNAGVAVGQVGSRMATWTQGGLALGGSGTIVAINNQGTTLIGTSGTEFSCSASQVCTRLSAPTGAFSGASALAINDNGVVAGYVYDNLPGLPGQTMTTVWTAGGVRHLLPSVTHDGTDHLASAIAINDNNVVIGTDLRASPNGSAALWDISGPGHETILGGGTQSTGYDLSDTGVAVGEATIDGDSRAVQWVNGQMMDLNTLYASQLAGRNLVLVSANVISDNGQFIAGVALNTLTAQTEGFLIHASAVPEPASPQLLLAGVAFVAFVARRQAARAKQKASSGVDPAP